MRFPKRWIAALGAAALTGLLVTGVAFAAGNEPSEKAGSKLSPGVQELMGEIRTLRQKHMDQLRAEVKALVDKAQTEGKITQEEANRLKQPALKGPAGHGKHPGHRGPGFMKNATEEQVKAKLDEAVKAGRLTQEQADQMLKKWQDWQARKQAETKQ